MKLNAEQILLFFYDVELAYILGIRPLQVYVKIPRLNTNHNNYMRKYYVKRVSKYEYIYKLWYKNILTTCKIIYGMKSNDGTTFFRPCRNYTSYLADTTAKSTKPFTHIKTPKNFSIKEVQIL